MANNSIFGGGRLGLLVAGGFVAVLPLMAGAGGFGCGGDETQLQYIYDQDLNGRTAYLKTNGGFAGGDAETGTDSSELLYNGEASISTSNGSIGGISGDKFGPEVNPAFEAFGPVTLFGTPGGERLEVSKVGDVDNDGTSDDTFFMFSHNQAGTEFSLSYGGTRTAAEDLQGLARRNSHTATYTGRGEFYTAIGPNVFRHEGDLEMTAEFDPEKQSIAGEINNLQQTDGVPVPGPVTFDRLKFDGQMDSSGGPDYQTGNFAHFNGAKNQVTDLTSEGVGSFFGSNAGGTLGVFSGRGKVINGGSDVNLIGGYRGHTMDNR